MDKDIIYIDPADDITDIISKIKEANEKAIALVPPKKSSVLHSSVNFKLIAKTAQTNKKDISLITTDDSLKHLAASASIPVASNVKAKATVPELDDVFAKTKPTSRVIEAPEEDSIEEEPVKSETDLKKSAKAMPKDLNSHREKPIKSDKKKDSIVPSFDKYRKWIIIGAVALIGLVIFLVWALVFAPGVTIEAKVRTTSYNLSKDVTFVSDEKKANPKEGVFLMKEETRTEKGEAEFDATGEKDKGKKASGSLTLTRDGFFNGNLNANDGSVTVPDVSVSAGTKFTYNNLSYVTTSSATLKGAKFSEGQVLSKCKIVSTRVYSCPVSSSEKINIEAEAAGDKYNSPGDSGWSGGSGYSVTSASVSGGSTEIVKVVTDQDIKNAESNIQLDADTDKIEKELFKKFDDDSFVLDNSFGVKSQTAASTPALGQEVSGNTKPKLKVEVTYHVLAVSRKDLDAYIKAQVQEEVIKDQKNQKIYSTGVEERAGEKKNRKNPKDQIYFQSIEEIENEGAYTARLKTVAETGLKIDEQGLLKNVLGKKIGEARARIEEQEGIVDVKVKSNFFWVNSVPNDANRVKIKVTIKED